MRNIKKKMQVLELEMEDGSTLYVADIMEAIKKHGIGNIKNYREVTRTFIMTPDRFIAEAEVEVEND